MVGGEYLRTLLNRLTDIDNIDKQKILIQDRIPTVFVLDVPVRMFAEDDLSWIIRNMATKWMCMFISKQGCFELSGGVGFSQVDPK